MQHRQLKDHTAQDTARDFAERAEQLFTAAPYRRLRLFDGAGPSTGESRTLTQVLNLRLFLTHEFTNPLLVGSEASRAATSFGARLLEREAQLIQDGAFEGNSTAALRYATLCALHPDPHGGSADDDASSMAALNRRWEQAHALGPRAWLKSRLAQHVAFYRHGLRLPAYAVRRFRVRRMVPAAVMQNQTARETFRAIEQVGPIVDNFAFRGRGQSAFRRDAGIADLVFLYMQMADEFVDTLRVLVGSDTVRRWVLTHYDSDSAKTPLSDMGPRQLAEIGLCGSERVEKYGTTLSTMLSMIRVLRQAIDEETEALEEDRSERVERRTHDFLHHCFGTYLDELHLHDTASAGRQETAWHFYRKNNVVMMEWLALRAELVGVSPASHTEAIQRWGYLLASFQIFDDLKDIGLDVDAQPNIALQVAEGAFPAEHARLLQALGNKRAPLTRDDVQRVNHLAPQTVLACIRMSRLMALAHFDNPLAYAWDQRWSKSWTRRRGSFNPPEPQTRRPEAFRTRLDQALQRLMVVCADVPEDELRAFAVDIAAYDGAAPVYVALFPNIRQMYRFATLQMWMSPTEKAAISKRVLRRGPWRWPLRVPVRRRA